MNNTSYATVFAEFKDKITDPDLITFSKDLQIEMLTAYMNKAIAKCKRVVKTVDLSKRDDELLEFSVEIPDDVMDIITEWMTVFWLQPYVNNIENLRNSPEYNRILTQRFLKRRMQICSLLFYLLKAQLLHFCFRLAYQNQMHRRG